MQLTVRVQQSLRKENPGEALRSLVGELHTEGWTKQQLYREFNALLEGKVRKLPESEQDLLRDNVLDALVGWCAPARRLLPEEPDVREHTL
ncbi:MULTISPECIES: hypothetical protein [Deinococcus]|uniref:Uncharacterized protein n=1 Tax=Deinococcus enclensis TaxID=1049582 RepID=A0ABT9MIV2_9DEIO|nr:MULTISPECIES: hypothetical protein [Deinococcus]MDP9766516.1 hypothetical protein [Deinococcus enclensis]